MRCRGLQSNAEAAGDVYSGGRDAVAATVLKLLLCPADPAPGQAVEVPAGPDDPEGLYRGLNVLGDIGSCVRTCSRLSSNVPPPNAGRAVSSS